ncbi:hypothetical protein SAMN04487983_104543 [Streptomyces sp. yr375]|nr:hypothetical protein SAMN04487983_104543 [Streptomyces sp. yr375]
MHRDVYRQGTQIAEGQAEQQLWALADQLNAGVVPTRRSAVLPYEVVATGRRGAVAYGGGMEDLDPGTRHVLPAPSDSKWTDGLTIRRLLIPVRGDHPGDGVDLAGRTYMVVSTDISAGDLSSAKVAALGVAADATLRVYVVVLPDSAEGSPRPPTVCCCGRGWSASC